MLAEPRVHSSACEGAADSPSRSRVPPRQVGALHRIIGLYPSRWSRRGRRGRIPCSIPMGFSGVSPHALGTVVSELRTCMQDDLIASAPTCFSSSTCVTGRAPSALTGGVAVVPALPSCSRRPHRVAMKKKGTLSAPYYAIFLKMQKQIVATPQLLYTGDSNKFTSQVF